MANMEIQKNGRGCRDRESNIPGEGIKVSLERVTFLSIRKEQELNKVINTRLEAD